mgnify:CR=1 FL=1
MGVVTALVTAGAAAMVGALAIVMILSATAAVVGMAIHLAVAVISCGVLAVVTMRLLMATVAVTRSHAAHHKL